MPGRRGASWGGMGRSCQAGSARSRPSTIFGAQYNSSAKGPRPMASSPAGEPGLKPGEMVEIKSREEIDRSHSHCGGKEPRPPLVGVGHAQVLWASTCRRRSPCVRSSSNRLAACGFRASWSGGTGESTSICMTPTDTGNQDEMLMSPPNPASFAPPARTSGDLPRRASVPGMRGPAMTRADGP